MMKTVTFVTNQYACDRIIAAARQVADQTDSELLVVGIMDNEYEVDPEAVDYLFNRSKEYGATMQLIFKEDKFAVMQEYLDQYDIRYVVSGMPSSNQSVLYVLWKEFEDKEFFTVDSQGQVVEVALPSSTTVQK